MSYSKFGKNTKDLLTKGFLDDKADKQNRRSVEFNGVSSHGTAVGFTANQKYSDDSIEGSLKITRSLKDLKLKTETEFKPDNISFTVTDDARVEGLAIKVNVEGNPDVLPKVFAKKAAAAEGEEEPKKECVPFGAYVDVEYKKNVNDDVDIAVNAKASHEKKDCANVLDVSFALGHSCGGSFGFQYKAPFNDIQKFKEASVGTEYAEGDLTVNGSYKIERKGEDLTSQVKVGVFHKYNDKTQWAAEAAIPVKGDGKAEVRGALQRTCGDETYKVRVAVPTGRLAGSFSTKLGAHTDLTLGAEGNMRNVFEGKAGEQKFCSKIAFNAK